MVAWLEGAVHNVQKRGITPIRSIRMANAAWKEFGEAAAFMGTNRSEVIQQLLSWLINSPGARLPERPPVDWKEQVRAARAS